MSAICGLFFRQGRPINLEFLGCMLNSLSHRGIDGASQWHKDAVGFGIQKLYNTPESLHETLPFYDSMQQLAIVADARIDNRDELCKKLNIDSQQTMADSQLILYAYQKWGVDCAAHLLGDFVITIWDEKNKRLIFFTDPCGLRSVYYYMDDHIIAFASEVKALLTLPEVPCRPNLTKIAKMDYIVESDGSNDTYFDSIFCIPAATTFVVSTREATQTHYWTPDINQRIMLNSEGEYIESFQTLFSQAIKARLRSAYPIASLLSGGLDSSAVTAMAAQLRAKEGQSLRTYSVVKAPEYADQCIDEQEFIDCFHDVPNLNRSYLTDGWRGPFDDLEQLIRAGESPSYSSRHFLFSAYAERMKQHGERVLLNGRYGEAGPSCPATGYLAELCLQGKIGTMIDEMRKKSRLYNISLLQIIKRDLLKAILPQAMIKPRSDLFLKQTTSILRPAFIAKQLGENQKKYSRQSFNLGRIQPDHRANQFKNLMYFIQEQKIKLKFVGYEHIERVYPYLDKHLVEFCLAIPGEMKMNNGYDRYMVRSGMRGLMPTKICHRLGKAPFSPDYHFRYNKQRLQALELVENNAKSSFIDEIINTEKLRDYLRVDMKTNRSLSSNGFKAMIAIPHGVYLLQFLKQFFME